jgi:hypothetical protein
MKNTCCMDTASTEHIDKFIERIEDIITKSSKTFIRWLFFNYASQTIITVGLLYLCKKLGYA